MIKVGWKNPRKRRSRLDIMTEILEIARGGAIKTHIMYKANLSFTQLNAYLTLLTETSLLEVVDKGEKPFYKTTEKGFQYIQGHNRIKALLTENPGKR